MLAAEAHSVLPAHLMPVDRIEMRWAVSIGSQFALDTWDDTPVAKPPPLDEETAIVVDQINLNAPYRQGSLLRSWYKSGVSSGVIASNLGVSRAGLFVEWTAALTWLRGEFIKSEHPDLLSLLGNFG